MNKKSRWAALLLALTMMTQTTAWADTGVSVDDVDKSTYDQWVNEVLDDRGPVVDEGGTLTDAATYLPEKKDTPVYETTSAQTLNVQSADGESTVSVSLPEKGMVQLSVSGGAGQWQVQVLNQWVAITGETASTMDVTYAKVKNLFDLNGEAKIRWLSEDGETASEIASVTLVASEEAEEEAILPDSAYAVNAAGLMDAPTSGTARTYNIVINYLFENGVTAAESYTANIAAGTGFSTTVQFPTVQGYLPYVDAEQKNSLVLDYDSVDADATFTVVYQPTNVSYTVIHYQQNVDNDNYTEVARETKQGLTNTQVPEVSNAYDGFYSLLYERPIIAADGSTVIEVYYDRYYYLMNFDLDGGYGVSPVYARYGASVHAGTPVKAGYIFEGWNDTIPSTMPAKNSTYTAKWQAGEAGFTVVFWYENANDDGYSAAGTYIPANVTPGTQVSSDDYKDQAFDGKDAEHFTYDSAKSETVTVAGDGSTVLNVYYTRNTYTLTFENGKIDVTCTKTSHTHSDACCKYGGTSLSHWFHRDSCCKLGLSEHTHTSKCYKASDLTITAKYGADIHANFPIKDANGETIWWRVPRGCKSFKVNNQLGSIDVMPGEDITFPKYDTETSADLYYYIETLAGEEGTYTHDGKNFKLYKSISLASGVCLTYTEEFHDIEGFTQWWSDPAFDKMEKGGTTETIRKGSKSYLCYTRNSYTLKFYNYNDFVDGKGGSVQYEASLSGYDFVPDYPANLEEGAYAFAGWYTTAGCYDGSEADLTTANMPASDVILYAKWIPVTHDVTFYLTEDSTSIYQPEGDMAATFTVSHGDNIAQDYVDYHLTKEAMNAAKPNGDYKFVVWYYYENGVKQYFDPTMQIRKSMTLYGEWSSDTLKSYTVQYVLKDDPTTKVADDLSASGLAGVTKTFAAKGGTELYADYQEGYFATAQSKSLLLDINAETLTLTFEYVQKDAVPYTVNYITAEKPDDASYEEITIDGKTYYKLASSYTNDTNRKAVVTEQFKVISGYMPDAYQKRLVVTADESGAQNVINFVYTKDAQHAYYKITHYTQNLDGTTWTEYASSQAQGDIGTTYTADAVTISGFTFDAAVEGTVTSGELTENGLELKLYYTRNVYPYQVRYLEQGSGKQLAEAQNGTGMYGQVISASAVELDGYDKVDPASQTMVIRIETDDTAKLNIITFYYTQKKATIKYIPVGPEGYNADGTPKDTSAGTVSLSSETLDVFTGEAQGSIATASGQTYRFVGWYDNAQCSGDPLTMESRYTPAPITVIGDEDDTAVGRWPDNGETYYAKFDYNETTLTITTSGCAGADAGQSFLFRVTSTDGVDLTIAINGNGSETISGLTVGDTVTVTALSDWSWRYAGGATSITLNSTGNQVTFTNSRTNAQWLDGDSYTENNFGAN